MKRNKKIVITSILAILLIVAIGVTFAIFSYTKMGANQQLVLGEIYMHYNEANAINLAGAMPGDAYNTNNTNSYFEFTISGKNTYTEKDIWYDISITRGEVPVGKTEANRIPDKYLKFRLVEVNNNVETELFTDETYDDLTNQRVYVAKIEKNTTAKINKTYRLYMVVSEKLTIGNQGELTAEEWESAFASVKVNVTGDFQEKVVYPTNFIHAIKATLGKTGGVVGINTDGGVYDPSDPTGVIREYRYIGAKVNNYVTYNNETWRIIGIFSEEKEDGTKEEYVKIVRNSILPSGSMPTSYYIASQDNTYTVGYSTTSSDAYWNNPATKKSTNYNDWTTAGLQYYLNTEQDDTEGTPHAGYLSTLSTEAKSLIRKSTYYLGNVKYGSSGDTATTAYISERTATQIYPGNEPTWKGFVGLMYASDYGYSVESSYWDTTALYTFNTADSKGVYPRSTSWMYTTMGNNTYWLLSPSSTGTGNTMYWSTAGYVGNNSVYSYIGVHPCLNLIPETKITSGEGTEISPYTLSIR